MLQGFQATVFFLFKRSDESSSDPDPTELEKPEVEQERRETKTSAPTPSLTPTAKRTTVMPLIADVCDARATPTPTKRVTSTCGIDRLPKRNKNQDY